MSLSSDISLSDIASVTRDNNGGFGDGNGWWIILLFILIGGAWGNGYGGGGAQQNYVLASDFATIQRQIADSTNVLERRTDNIINGLSNGFYTNAQLANQTNMSVMQTGNAIQSQLADCCCQNKSAIADVKYAMAMNTNDITRSVDTGFCQTNFNNQQNTRDIIANQDANTRAILDSLTQSKLEAKNEKIAEQAQMISALQLSASQARQNEYLLGQLKPCPNPAYIVPNPYGCGCGC